MENWNDKQNEMFGNVFNALKKVGNPTYKSDALAMLHLDNENFTKLYRDTTEITGDEEDIDLCIQRAKSLGI